jgi:hypothetical protein
MKNGNEISGGIGEMKNERKMKKRRESISENMAMAEKKKRQRIEA